jgi:hypothetical protein
MRSAKDYQSRRLSKHHKHRCIGTVLGQGCGQLQSISLHSCNITDDGVSALANGCDQLQYVSLHYCRNITDIDIGVLALRARNCSVKVKSDHLNTEWT